MATSRIVMTAIAAATATLVTGTAQADFFGDTVSFVYYFPDSATVYADLGTGAVPVVFDLRTSTPPVANTGTATVTVNADQIIVNLDPDFQQFWSPASFNGWVLTDITQDPGITGVTIGSQSNFLLAASMISFTSNSITVNWQGLDFGVNDAPSTVTLDVSFAAPVPIPAALPLFAGGLGLLGWMARRKRSQAAHAGVPEASAFDETAPIVGPFSCDQTTWP
jgi:hypothetical protein